MRILFQGDSITESCRDENNKISVVGMGYPLLVESALGFEAPGKYEFVNRGISGNKVTDVYARIKNDIINIQPDVMSILIGVNDVWQDLRESPCGVNSDKYYKTYNILIEEVKTALPNIKIMIMEPFVLKGYETEEKWDFFNEEVQKRAYMAKKISAKYNLPYIPLQKGFEDLSHKARMGYWLWDGVHPTPMGHEYIKNEWIKAFKNYV